MTAPPTARRFCILGARSAAGCGPGYFDAFDAAVELSTGRVVAFGARTPEAVPRATTAGLAQHIDHNRRWGEYQPLAVTADIDAVSYFDFGRVLWLGPTPRPCLVWTNAIGINVEGVRGLLRLDLPSGLTFVDGEHGDGLPTLESLGRTVTPDARWYDVATA